MKTLTQIQKKIDNMQKTLKEIQSDTNQTSWHYNQMMILQIKINELEWVIEEEKQTQEQANI